ncbi:phospholipid transport system transporter-binding protein [Kushneria sinocarnis]|uniref:Phospholipid transport system transporter-binding protein n=1 Tax=Kushneria sinocarnis TaxID=595502 RepID=A0A420WVB9_9GAMM|nr:STAS domain-containing protein [Kushneria sinocarnis]RKR02521.1 phospholipid transport system transporter-binding protein [Kushneria sinocarnis]
METLLERKEVCLQAEAGTLRVTGFPDFDDAAELARAGVSWLESQSCAVTFDACGVHRISSAMLSVMLEWMRAAQRLSLSVDRIVLSERLHELIELADLSEVFPVESETC